MLQDIMETEGWRKLVTDHSHLLAEAFRVCPIRGDEYISTYQHFPECISTLVYSLLQALATQNTPPSIGLPPPRKKLRSTTGPSTSRDFAQPRSPL